MSKEVKSLIRHMRERSERITLNNYHLTNQQLNLLLDYISELEQNNKIIKKALDIAYRYSQIDGSHHKAWVIDQMVRKLLGKKYKKWVKNYMFGNKTPEKAIADGDYYEWDNGIAP